MHMRLLPMETESNLGTLWDQEECQLCSKAELWEAVYEPTAAATHAGACSGPLCLPSVFLLRRVPTLLTLTKRN